MSNFDLKQVNVLEFLEELEIRNISEETTEEVRFSCPFPGHMTGDENPSAYMNRDSTAWFCHGCKRKGNAVTFLSDLHNVSHVVSHRFLRERFGGGFQVPKDTLEKEIYDYFMVQEKPTVEPINYALQQNVLSDFSCLNEASCAYLQDRGFTQGTIEKFQLGWDEKSTRITIPIFDEVGRLVGFKGRAIDPDNVPKYKVIGGSQYGWPRYHIGLVVFGINYVSPEIDAAILVEGELNAIAMHQMTFDHTIAIGGSTFTDTHAAKIIDRFDSILLYFDSDKAGAEATRQAAKKLEPHMKVYIAPDHDEDPADILQTYGIGDGISRVVEVTSAACASIELALEPVNEQ